MFKEQYYKYGFIITLIVFSLIGYLMIQPYLVSIMTSFLLAYVCYPLYTRINNRLKNKDISSFVVCVIILFVIMLPFLFIMNKILVEVPKIYYTLLNYASGTTFDLNQITDNIYKRFGVMINFSNIVQSIFSGIVSIIRTFLTSLPNRILNVFVIFFLLYFFLRDGKRISKKLLYYLPLHKKERTKLFKQLKATVQAVIYGHIVTAMVQGIIGSIGFLILGFSSPAFWGLIMFLFALIPFIGTPFVYVPVSVVSFGTSLLLNDSVGMIKAVLLLAYGTLIVSSVDNIIKPKIISDQVKIHPAVIVLGILGGVNLFGVIGIIIGPLVLSILQTLIRIFGFKEKI